MGVYSSFTKHRRLLDIRYTCTVGTHWSSFIAFSSLTILEGREGVLDGLVIRAASHWSLLSLPPSLPHPPFLSPPSLHPPIPLSSPSLSPPSPPGGDGFWVEDADRSGCGGRHQIPSWTGATAQRHQTQECPGQYVVSLLGPEGP